MIYYQKRLFKQKPVSSFAKLYLYLSLTSKQLFNLLYMNLFYLKVTALSFVYTLIFSLAKSQESPLFRQLSPKETGVKFSNNIHNSENLNVLSYEYFYNGGGVAVGDINNDGLPDLFFTANMEPNKLYLNLGDMKFKDITRNASEKLEGSPGSWKTGATMADVNGDGLLDIYVCYSGKVTDDKRRNQLFINMGNLKFEEKAAEYGLDDKSHSTQAAFFDFDNDGDLDVFLLNHSTRKIDNSELSRYRAEVDELAGNKLYENRNNRFVDISRQAGITQNPLTFGLGITITDIDKDGWQDIYVTNDYNEPDYFYINNHNGTFTESSRQYFRYLAQFSMGVDIADFNNDGLPDVYSLDMLPEDNYRQKTLQIQEKYEHYLLMVNQGITPQYMRNVLQLNNGDKTFSEIAQFAGVSNTDWSWCPLFADFDNDGFKDILVTNGYLRDYTDKDFLRHWGDYKIQKAMKAEPVQLMDLVNAMPETKLNNYIFKNNGNLTFTNQVKQWGLEHPGISSGAVYADLDNDGDLDIVINQLNDPALIYKNTSRESGNSNFISLELKYKTANIYALGAKVYIFSKGMMQYQEVNPSRGYLSCLPTVLHFGLAHQTTIDSIKIIWPDNTMQIISNVTPNQKLTLQYGKDSKPYTPEVKKTFPLFRKAPDYIKYNNKANTENDFTRQPLMMFMYSKTSPVMAKGDVNKDGLEDLFISGQDTQTGRLYIQNANGQFSTIEIGDESQSTISAAAFFDANGDGYQDLYIAKGGYAQYEPDTKSLQDELYINDGKGNLTQVSGYLPVLNESSKSCVRPCDFDNDGDIDIFVGGRIIPGKYPLAPKSYLLVNNGHGKFTSSEIPFSTIGMVTDAAWTDVDSDGRKDLVICGEFMPIMIFLNKPAGFIDATEKYFGKKETGIWFSLQVADLDGDGKEDIVAGNIGQNTPIHISPDEPATLYYADFDYNGTLDPFLNFYIQGKSYPFVSRSELNDQIPAMRRKFATYKDYANATMKTIFSNEELERATKLEATECRSVIFFSRNDHYEKKTLPSQAQFSVITRTLIKDFNSDNKPDILLMGNLSDNRLKIGAIDSNYGCVLLNNGNGDFEYLPQFNSGLSIRGDVKGAEFLNIGGKQLLTIGISNNNLLFYEY